jgi:hypothetical protein
MLQKVLDQRCSPKSARQRQMTFWCLFNIIDELGSSKPTLFSLDFPIRRSPADLSTKGFKIAFALFPFFLLRQTRNGRRICDKKEGNYKSDENDMGSSVRRSGWQGPEHLAHLLYRVTKFASREFVPQPFNGSQVR